MDQRAYPTTSYNIARAKVSDGKSVRVVVPENTTVIGEEPTLLGGFFGFPVQSVTTAAGQTSEVIMNIAQEEFETDKVVVADSFPGGALVYWDDTAKKLTTTAATNRKVGRVTAPKDANNVIWFILGPQVL